MDKTQVFLGIPVHDGTVSDGAVKSIMAASKKHTVNAQIGTLSLLPRNFNTLYCQALNLRKEGVTHFALLHADILASPFWIDTMIDLLEKHEAGVISAIVPIKNQNGFTSTAIDENPKGKIGEDYYHEHRPRRLTLKEVYKMDPTFTDERILLNTGCMVIDIRQPWATEISFRFDDHIVYDDKKDQYVAIGMSEDWIMSRQLRRLGVKQLATREVMVSHLGRFSFSNGSAWGSQETDKK